MSPSTEFLSPSEAARRLGVSAKALRLYEQCGLVSPVRTAAGWRVYGPEQMARAAEVAALRGFGLGLAQVARVLAGDAQALEPMLASHQARLEDQMRQLVGAVGRVRDLRADLARGHAPAAADLARLLEPRAELVVAFDLPWPWGGERFELRRIRPLNWIIGPLGSGKTQLARRIAETLPGGVFFDMNRAADMGSVRAKLGADKALGSRVDQALALIIDDGATNCDALLALLVGLEAEAPAAVVVDMVEQGLDQPTQEVVIAHLRRRAGGDRPLFLMTRSSAMLDLAEIGPDEAIILCPANHSPPMHVAPYPGAPGYEAVATCLASPDVRARTEGMIAFRPTLAAG